MCTVQYSKEDCIRDFQNECIGFYITVKIVPLAFFQSRTRGLSVTLKLRVPSQV